MNKTKEIHPIWKEWNEIPQEMKTHLIMQNPIIGKWHYHYENKNGKIGLVKLNYNLNLNKDKWQNYCWEACGILEYRRFNTKEEAEKAIYKALKEKR